jgi:hypothetical protein
VDGDPPHDPPTTDERQRPSATWRRRLRSYVDLGLLALLVGAAAIIAQDGGDDAAPPGAVSATTQPARAAVPEPYPLLAAPATAGPGEVVSIVAYRHRGLCGHIELRLDGVRLDHRVTATIEAPHPDWDTVLLTVRIPAASSPDVHRLELAGPVPGRGRGGPRCGDGEQRWGPIATTTLEVSTPAG